jgi:hypothetical protein
MTTAPDRLFDLLPAEYRIRDAERGWPLRALLRVIAEQVDMVEADIARLYDNWFIETCQEWVVPYIGDLVGYRSVPEAGRAGAQATVEGRLLNRILIPRREVANTLRDRRRKGALALLEMLALEVAGWPAHAVEFFRLLAWTQNVKFLRAGAGGLVSLDDAEVLERVGGPFDPTFHTIDVRRPNSSRTPGKYSIPSAGVYVWRLKAYPVTRTPAYAREDVDPQWFTFSILGNDTALFTHPRPEADPSHIAGRLNVPAPIRRRAMAGHIDAYYGPEASLQIWIRDGASVQCVEASQVRVANLERWAHEARSGTVMVDPELGRIGFPPDEVPSDVWVSYHYGFSADIGGGAYRRQISEPARAVIYRVARRRKPGRTRTIGAALKKWEAEGRPPAVIEIVDDGFYEQREPLTIDLGVGSTLQLRAAQGRRPIIRLLDWGPARQDFMVVKGGARSRLTLEGLLIAGRGIRIRGRDLAAVTLRHSTLVPGWQPGRDEESSHRAEPSIEMLFTRARLSIEHSIVGAIHANAKAGEGPVEIEVTDSILDAGSPDRQVLGEENLELADVDLRILRSTVFGRLTARAIQLAENSIFTGTVNVARRHLGCMRFCSVPAGSRTPRRYECQPDLAEQAALEGAVPPTTPQDEAEHRAAEALARLQVKPRFTSKRYGEPGYAQLAGDCAEEITSGADDRSEMGVFHDLFQPQRAAALRARLTEYTPAEMDVGLFFAT